MLPRKCYFYRTKIVNYMYTVKTEDKAWEIDVDAASEKLSVNGSPMDFQVQNLSDRYRRVTLNGTVYHILLEGFDKTSKTVTLRVNGERKEYSVKDRSDELLKKFGIQSFPAPKVNELKSPMPGLVVQILVKEGDVLAKGDPIVVLEAMKMENVLKAPAEVTVKSIHAEPGKAVEKNAVLVRFE